jgi:hypothetical protein
MLLPGAGSWLRSRHLLSVSLSLCHAAQSVTLAWNAPSDPSITGYKLKYGTSGNPSPDLDVGKTTTFTVSNLNDLTTYFFTVVAYNAAGVESQPSNQISYTTPGPSATPPISIGETNILASPDSGNGSLLVAQQANLTQTATIQSLSFYVTNNASGKLRLGIFDATGPNGGPGTKKAETAEITPTVGWNKANVITPVSLPQGTYWLAYHASDNNLAFVKNLSGQARYYTDSYGPMPATFSTSPQSEVVHWSLFATLTTSGGVSSADKIRYYPRTNYASRMVLGVFEGTSGHPVTGTYTTIHTVTNNPPTDWSEVSVNLGNYRYLRYRGPNGSYGNVAEVEFYRNGVKLNGTKFGTTGSWNNEGNTFDKALDWNEDTFFDAPINDGAYVGIDTQ